MVSQPKLIRLDYNVMPQFPMPEESEPLNPTVREMEMAMDECLELAAVYYHSCILLGASQDVIPAYLEEQKYIPAFTEKKILLQPFYWHLRPWDKVVPAEDEITRYCDSRFLCGVDGFTLLIIPQYRHTELAKPEDRAMIPLLDMIRSPEPDWSRADFLKDYAVSMIRSEVPEAEIFWEGIRFPNTFLLRLAGWEGEALHKALQAGGILIPPPVQNGTLLEFSLNPHWDQEEIDDMLAQLVPLMKQLVPDDFRYEPPELDEDILNRFFLEEQQKHSDCSRDCGDCGDSDCKKKKSR